MSSSVHFPVMYSNAVNWGRQWVLSPLPKASVEHTQPKLARALLISTKSLPARPTQPRDTPPFLQRQSPMEGTSCQVGLRVPTDFQGSTAGGHFNPWTKSMTLHLLPTMKPDLNAGQATQKPQECLASHLKESLTSTWQRLWRSPGFCCPSKKDKSNLTHPKRDTFFQDLPAVRGQHGPCHFRYLFFSYMKPWNAPDPLKHFRVGFGFYMSLGRRRTCCFSGVFFSPAAS